MFCWSFIYWTNAHFIVDDSKKENESKNRYTIGNNLIYLNLFLHFYMFSVLELMTSQEQIYRCISLCFRLRNRKDRKKNEGVICRFV
jgi:hypothetical protein